MTICDFVSLYTDVSGATLPYRISSTGLLIFHYMPPLLPRGDFMDVTVTNPINSGLPHTSIRSALSTTTFEATYRFTFVAACNFAVGNSRPLITQTPLPRATEMNSQFPGRDLNPLDKQLLLRTDVVDILKCLALVCLIKQRHTSETKTEYKNYSNKIYREHYPDKLWEQC
jgi:hypothetical protein